MVYLYYASIGLGGVFMLAMVVLGLGGILAVRSTTRHEREPR